MRVLSSAEILVVAGGEMESNESPYDMQVAGLAGDIAKQIGWSLAWDYVKSQYDRIGQAGSNPPANETDNGGTSYGISSCNTFGCS